MPAQQRTPYRDYQEYISLESPPPNKIGDQWSVTVVATARKGKFPLSGGVSFYLGGVFQGSTPIDGNGVASMTFLLGKGVHEFVARREGLVSNKILVPLKDDPPKKVEKIILEYFGANGSYTLFAKALTGDGKGVGTIFTTLIQESGLEAPKILETNEFGATPFHRVTFNGLRRVYYTIAAGLRSDDAVLLGPPPKR